MLKAIQILQSVQEFEKLSLGIERYENEHDVMSVYINSKQAEKCARATWNSETKLAKDNVLNEPHSITESINLREQGNALFKASPEQNSLDACRLYTKAILLAPFRSEALALAHANRAIALQKFGYFQQAYDDCECALEQGYPLNLKHKIIARQATCALKLGDAELLQKHLDALNAMSLNQSYELQIQQLQKNLIELKNDGQNMKKNGENNDEFRGSHKIIITESKGRCLIAENPIERNELIFTERAFSFVPATERHVCQQCAATQLIPFPCYHCYGKAVYCSLKCRDAHQSTHSYECVAHRNDVFIGSLNHLALRMVLEGVPEILCYLREKKTSKEIWNEITCEESALMRQSNIKYIETLRMISHLNKLRPCYGKLLAHRAYLISWYLRNQTNFFDIFKSSKASLKEWQIVIAALALRHCDQLRCSISTPLGLTIKIDDPSDSTLLNAKFWKSPYHVRRGSLHMICNIEGTIQANFPYYSLCNNACSPSIVTKKNGRYLSAYATNKIEAGNEILNTYTAGYRNFRRTERQSYLKESFHFDCTCDKCINENSDDEYESFRRFRCEKCQKLFIHNNNASKIRCPDCGSKQPKLIIVLEFLNEFLKMDYREVVNFGPVLNLRNTAFMELDRWLVGPNALKMQISLKLVEKCFEMYNTCPALLRDYNFSEVINILKFHLNCKIKRFHLKALDYIGPMTYLWDFIALGKYQCDAKEMQEMLEAIEILPDEINKLFTNYYTDYIAGNIKK